MGDETPDPPRRYVTGPAATAARTQYGPGVAVQVGGEWCWPALTDEEVYRDRWL
jgi:hypothetical protein